MKAWVLREYNKRMEMEEVDVPVPGPSEIVLKVGACGICGTDLKIVSGKIPPPIVTLPHTPGHEIAGEVAAVGSAVSGVRVGQKGVVYFYIGCKDCEMCRTGRENVCFSIRRLGFELHGGFAEYVKLPAYNFCAFSEDFPVHEMAVLPDAIVTSYHALKIMAEVKGGQDVLIMGAGGLGIHAVQIAKLMGARVIAVARREMALTLAVEHGADVAIDSTREDASKQVLELTRGRGVDVIIENVGTAQSMAWSLPLLKRRGRLVLVGYDPTHPIPINAMQMHYNEWTITGSRTATKQDLLEVIDLVERKKIRPVVSKLVPWTEANEAIEGIRQRTGIGRTVLTF